MSDEERQGPIAPHRISNRRGKKSKEAQAQEFLECQRIPVAICETRHPQNLPVRAPLSKVRSALDALDFFAYLFARSGDGSHAHIFASLRRGVSDAALIFSIFPSTRGSSA